MSEIVTAPALAALLAERTHYKADFCQLLITELFKTIASNLKPGGTVEIKGLGRFVVSDEGEIDFISDQKIAAIVNEPFSAFEPVELENEVNETILAGDIATDENDDENELPHADKPVHEEDATPSTKIVEEQPDEAEQHEQPIEKGPVDDSNAVNKEPASLEMSEEWISEEDEENELYIPKSRFWSGFWIGTLVGMIIGGCFLFAYIDLTESKSEPEAVIVQSPTIQEPETQITEATDQSTLDDRYINSSEAEAIDQYKETFDTVSVNYYLTKMARKHYNHLEYWVYIYEENSDRLGNPDLIEPGTIVKVPSLDKYGIENPEDPASLKAAKAKSAEIYRRFGK